LQTIGVPHYLLDQHRFGLRPERDAHCVGKLRGATQHFLTGIRAEKNLLGAHGLTSAKKPLLDESHRAGDALAMRSFAEGVLLRPRS